MICANLRNLRMKNSGNLIIEERPASYIWVFAHRKKTNGVIFIRFPGNIRLKLGQMVLSLVEKHGTELIGNFTVLEPGRARIRKSPLSL